MIDKKTVDVYAMFNDELNAIRKELTQKLVALPASHPKYAGQAHWARMLRRGIERSMLVCYFTFFFAANLNMSADQGSDIRVIPKETHRIFLVKPIKKTGKKPHQT